MARLTCSAGCSGRWIPRSTSISSYASTGRQSSISTWWKSSSRTRMASASWSCAIARTSASADAFAPACRHASARRSDVPPPPIRRPFARPDEVSFRKRGPHMPQMIPVISFALSLATQPAVPTAPSPNTLTAAEKAAGWQLLFDGRSLDGWRGYRRDALPDSGWEVKDGTIRTVAKVKGADIVTRKTFTDFELSWEWRVLPGGNNGVRSEEHTSEL